MICFSQSCYLKFPLNVFICFLIGKSSCKFVDFCLPFRTMNTFRGKQNKIKSICVSNTVFW